MDRRQKKTKKAIYDAFTELIQEKDYSEITIQDIIDRADIGRSTFYSHFRTKDELLEDMCDRIFHHIFTDHATSEDTHDFSDSTNTLSDMLTHLLYHLRSHREIVTGMLLRSSSPIFLRYLDEYLTGLFRPFIPTDLEAPFDYLLDAAIHSFSRTVTWWAERGMKDTPESVEKMFSFANPWLKFETGSDQA
jgi:AcrR family transcriptional regulator